MNLTIAYMTNRREPHIEWFYNSLRRQGDVNTIVIDFHGIHGPKPKPTPWQGEHRLTSVDYFAAANARNTALCLAPDGWIAFVDDLSVLMPGWLAAVKEAMRGGYIACGAYRKVKNIVVKDGLVESFDDYPGGRDARWRIDGPCPAGWLFGCSVAGPVDAFLSINGWPEAADGMGFEDCITGVVLANAGYELRYVPEMLTLESEEHHHRESKMKLIDKGTSPRSKSHALLAMYGNAKRFPNWANLMREVRALVRAGEPFPLVVEPQHDWFDGQPLREM